MKSKSIIRVRYAETDKMGFAYYSNFLIYFEVGRTDYFRDRGVPYRKLEEDHVYVPVTETYCRYFLPAFYDDLLEVYTSLQKLSRLKFKFIYEVFRPTDKKLLAEGYTVHVPINSSGAPCRMPQEYLSLFEEEVSE